MEQRGRKKLEDQDDVAKPTSISLSKNNKAYLVKKYGALSAAINSLLPNDNSPEVTQPKPPSIPKSIPSKTKSVEPTLAELWGQANKSK